jgi:hypothetical protein
VIPSWLQDVAVWTILGAAVWSLVRRFGQRRARACPGCAPARRSPSNAVRARGLTILP